MQRIGLTLTALVSAAAMAACSSSSSGGGTPAGSNQPSTSSTAASGSFDKTAAQATAQAALLTAADFPDGWTASPSQESKADDATINQGLANCFGVPASIFASSGPEKVEASSDYSSPNNGATGQVSEHVDVETSDEITKEFAVVNSSKLASCMETVYQPFLKQKFAQDPQTKDAKIGTVTAVRANLPSYGDQSAGVEITVPITIGAASVKAVIDLIFVRVGNLSAQLSFESTGQAFDTATAASITSKATAKLSAAKS